MKSVVGMICIALLVSGSLGCREEQRKPATRPAATAPSAAAGGTTQPADAGMLPVSALRINDEPVLFPPARLRLEQRDGTVCARLFSDDPPKGVNEDYVKNFYFFEMALDIAEPSELTSAVWTYEAESSERADSPNGIFRRGMKEQLQPYKVRISFSKKEGDAQETGEIAARITGEFLLFQEHSVQPQSMVVDGVVESVPQIKRSASP